MLMPDFVDTASFRLPLSPAASRILPSAYLFTNSAASRPHLHKLHDTQSDSSTGGACQVSLLPERRH